MITPTLHNNEWRGENVSLPQAVFCFYHSSHKHSSHFLGKQLIATPCLLSRRDCPIVCPIVPICTKYTHQDYKNMQETHQESGGSFDGRISLLWMWLDDMYGLVCFEHIGSMHLQLSSLQQEQVEEK